MGADYALYVKAIFWVYFSALASVLPLHLAHVCTLNMRRTTDSSTVMQIICGLKNLILSYPSNQNEWTWTAMPTQQMKWLVRIFQTSLKLPLCHLPLVYWTEIYEMCPKTNLGHLSFFFGGGIMDKGCLFSESFSLCLKSPKKRCQITILCIFSIPRPHTFQLQKAEYNSFLLKYCLFLH